MTEPTATERAKRDRMTEPSYRVGRHLGRTVYRVTDGNDEVIGMMDTPELGALVVAALNAYPPAERPADDACAGVSERIAAVLLAHQRLETGACACGWNVLGQRFSRHVADAILSARPSLLAAEAGRQ